MKRFRIAAISYLNTAPLMWDFEHGDAGAEFDISYTLPSQCATNLRDGSADIGIIPAAAYAGIPDLTILPGVAIASRRAVRSILLVSQVPLEKIRSVALDTSSLTSVALTKLLFEKWWGADRTFVPMPPDLRQMMEGCDAGLVIGDPALKIDRSPLYHLRISPRRVDSPHRQTVCFCLLGGQASGCSGIARQFGSRCAIPGLPRPRTAPRERRSHRARLDAPPGVERT